MKRLYILLSLCFASVAFLVAQHDDHGSSEPHALEAQHNMEATEQHSDAQADAHGTAHTDTHSDDHGGCGEGHGHEFDPGSTAFHHISDANVYSIGPWQFPLPCILYAPGHGWDIFMSSKFKFDRFGHGDGHYAYRGYVLDGGSVKRVADENFPKDQVEIAGIYHNDENVAIVCYNDHQYETHAKSTADGGVFGGGITSYYDFSITKNVFSMIIVFILLTWMFLTIAKRYGTRKGKAPKGIQSLVEPVFLFIQDEVVKPFLGDKYMRYQPFIMALFFFILGLNLWGQVPFLGGSNVTGNLAVTFVLAIFAFLVTNLSGNKHYWEHIFWMPGVPAWVKIILTPVEMLGVFIKPLTLTLRLFANITAGHMVVIIFVGLIFIFGQSGENMAGGFGTSIASTLLTIFMMSIELLVAFIQAFVFAILTASYIGAATESHGHSHEEGH